MRRDPEFMSRVSAKVAELKKLLTENLSAEDQHIYDEWFCRTNNLPPP